METRSTTLVLGCRGMLGSSCMRAFAPRALGCDLAEFDIAGQEQTLEAITRLAPEVIINCAAATDVDRCETDHMYADKGNEIGPRNVAEAAAALGSRLLHVSTDFVFDGAKAEPYSETDEPGPICYYGLSKLRGEEAVLSALPSALVVRTSWLYGRGTTHFPAKVLSWAAARPQIKVVEDQVGSPTYAEDLADAFVALLGASAPAGIYHLGGSGCVSRYDWARETLAMAGLTTEVLPALTAEFPAPAERPAYSCLDCSKAAALGVRLPPWREGLARYIRTRP
jgi:dTDP-4-dehydrorhamnose reductase